MWALCLWFYVFFFWQIAIPGGGIIAWYGHDHIGSLSLLLALGEYGGLYRIQSLIPIANRFRFPAGLSYLSSWL